MCDVEETNAGEQDLAEIAAAQRRLIQLLARTVAERLANEGETRESESGQPRQQA